jgi:hypothetical protein
MKKNTLSLTLLAGLSIFSATSSLACYSDITLENVTKDVSFLASDKLKGRASFSKEIDQAADYISKRFAEVGLVPAKNTKNFKQTFTVHTISPLSIKVNINNTEIAEKNITMATTMSDFTWQDTKDVQTHIIGENDDMRAILSKINKQGGQHLVLLNNKHEKMFAGYQNYFNHGLTKLSLNHQGAIVLVLMDDNLIDKTAIKKLSVIGKAEISQKSLTNIVGMLPGKNKAKEIVLFSSHYDHLGMTNTSPNESSKNSNKDTDSIYNGADDDASGTSAIINIAHYYANKKNNARTLIFSAFTAEEIGGYGSRYFSEHIDSNSITAMINIEMVGKPSKFGAGTIWMTGMERSNLGALLNENLKDKNIEIYQDPYPEQGLFYRSDNATLARLGVPAHSFSSTQLDKDKHYHKVSDDIASLDLNSLHKVVQTLATATQGLVDGSVTPSRIDTTKVKGNGLIY